LTLSLFFFLLLLLLYLSLALSHELCFVTGVILRDSHGVAQVRFVTGNKILRILKGKGLAPDLPEDLYCLIKKAVNIRKHLERNRKVSTQVLLRLVSARALVNQSDTISAKTI
jgi:ribosomal protein S15P/S13E